MEKQIKLLKKYGDQPKCTEKQLHKQICSYLHLQYKNVIFNTDASGIKLSMGQAVQMKYLRSGNGFPDIQILEPRNHYSGLFLEVKKECPYLKKDWKLKNDKHLQEQVAMHNKLKERLFEVYFVWEFEQAKNIIDEYLKNKL